MRFESAVAVGRFEVAAVAVAVGCELAYLPQRRVLSSRRSGSVRYRSAFRAFSQTGQRLRAEGAGSYLCPWLQSKATSGARSLRRRAGRAGLGAAPMIFGGA
jgi:hypothetical protein